MITPLLRQMIAVTLFGMILSWFATYHMDLLAFFLGTLWGICNVLLTAFLVKQVLVTKNYFHSFFTILIKFPFLYWIGYQLLKSENWNPWYAALGFPVVLVVLVIQLLYRFSYRNA